MKNKIFIISTAVCPKSLKWLIWLLLFLPLGPGILLAQIPNLPGSGNCLSFNGTSDYVSVNNNPALQLSNTGTIEAWINISVPLNAWGVIAAKRISGSFLGYNYEFDLNKSGDQLRGLLSDGTKNNIIIGSTRLTANVWYHVVFTWDGSQLKLFLNGMLDGVSAQLNNANITTFPLEIARGNDPSPVYFSGTIDEVRIWNIALTQTEIRNTMCQKLVGNEPGLVGYWRFDETSGTTAYDSSPNGNNGILK